MTEARRQVFFQARTALLVMGCLFVLFFILEKLGFGDQKPQYIFTIGLTPMVSGSYLGLAIMYITLPFRDLEFFITAVLAVLLEAYLFTQRPYTWDMETRLGAVGIGIGIACWFAMVYRISVTRGIEREQAKGYLCVASILPMFPKVSSWLHYLVISNSPVIYDQYGYAIDGLLGFQPAIWMERLFLSQPLVHGVALWVYNKLPLFMVVATVYWLNRPSRVYFNPLMVMVIIAPFCMLVYYMLPMIGISLIFPEYPPASIPVILQPVPMPLKDMVPVSCMPSMHATWIFIIFLCMVPQGRLEAVVSGMLVMLTLMATLGREAGHYSLDLCMAFPFLLFFVGVFLNHRPINLRWRIASILFGGLTFLFTLYLIRFHIQFLVTHGAFTLSYLAGLMVVSTFLHWKMASLTLRAQAAEDRDSGLTNAPPGDKLPDLD